MGGTPILSHFLPIFFCKSAPKVDLVSLKKYIVFCVTLGGGGGGHFFFEGVPKAQKNKVAFAVELPNLTQPLGSYRVQFLLA